MLKIRQSEDRKVYFTSDLHLGHKQEFIWKSRGYESHDDHNTKVIETINSVVRPNDVLFILGDFCLNTTFGEFNVYIKQIKCDNNLMLWGNHNNPHEKSVYKPLVSASLDNQVYENQEEEYQVYPVSYENVKYIGHYAEVAVDGQLIILFHYPISSWNYMAHGAWMLHGHEHSSVKEHLPEGSNGKILDVGWDYFKTPVSFETIDKIMNAKNIKSVGHH
jgi:calcineurin-like phosphoesterase family protein